MTNLKSIVTQTYEKDEITSRVQTHTRKYDEVFADLKSFVENIKTDVEIDYITNNDYNRMSTKENLPADAIFVSKTDFGASEGIYTDLSLSYYAKNSSGQEVLRKESFATIKTLEDSSYAFMKMCELGGKCQLMLSGNGREINFNKEYFVEGNQCRVEVLKQNEDTALLKRIIPQKENPNNIDDPTPYIVASGFKVTNIYRGTCCWDQGKYCSNLENADIIFEQGELYSYETSSTNDELFSKVKTEYEDYIQDLQGKNPLEVINKAYEITVKENIVQIFENTQFSKEEEKTLLALEKPLSAIYTQWISSSYTDTENLPDVIKSIAEVDQKPNPSLSVSDWQAEIESRKVEKAMDECLNQPNAQKAQEQEK